MHTHIYCNNKTLFHSIIAFFLFFTQIQYIHAEQKTPAPQFLHSLYTKKFSLQLRYPSAFTDTIQKKIQKQTPNLGSELQYSFSIPKAYLETMTDTEIDLLMLKTLLAVRSQKGIQYYSNSRQAYHAFIKDIYTVASQNDKTPIRDIVPLMLQPSIDATIFKHDNSFGKGIFSYTIAYKNSHEFLISIENLENIFYNIFLLIATPRTLTNNILIQRDENIFTIYAISYSSVNMPFEGVRERAAKSLLYRMFALVQWFEKEITISLQKSQRN